MGTIRRLQTAFSAGALDPRLKGRKEVGLYYVGCDELPNSIVRPQGSAQTRPCIRSIAVISDAPYVRLAPFVFDATQRYLVMFIEGEALIYDAATDTAVDSVETPFAPGDLASIDYVQIADTMLVCHPEHSKLFQLRREIDGTFTWSDYVFERSPKYRYQSRSARMQPSATTGTIYLSCLDGPAFKPGYAIYGDAAQSAEYGEQWMFRGAPCVILSVEGNGASALVQLFAALPDTEPSTDWAEQAHSRLWGGYRSIAYFQGRLWLGGTKSAPTQIFASRVGAPYDFYDNSADDADPFDFEMSGGRLEPILHLVPGSGGLEVYTAGDEAIVPGNDTAPITPRSATYVPQSAFGSRQVKPVRLNSNTVFVQRSSVLRENIYSEAEQVYLPQSVSVRSAHILGDPVRMASVSGGFGLPLDFIIIVNGDGTGALMTSERAQEVAAWAPMTIPGRATLDICAVGDAVYVGYQRAGAGLWIGRFDTEARFDAERRFTFEEPTASLAGLAEFAGETVHIWGDGRWLGSAIVTEDGSLTMPAAVRDARVGLLYDWRIRPMPPEMEQDSLLGRKIRPVRAEVRFQNTAGLRVNGQIVHDRSLEEAFAGGPIERTGVKRVQLMGWSNGERCPVVVTREGPYPVEIIALAVDYRIGGS